MGKRKLEVVFVGDTKQLDGAFRRVSGQAVGLGAKMQQTGAQMQAVGSKMTRRVSVPLLAVGAAALKVGGEFQSSMNRVSALTGATGKDFDSLRLLAKKLGTETQYSASQAADAMGFLAQAGFKTKDILSAMPSVLSLAAAGQMDIARTGDIASNVMTGFGIKASEMGRAADALTYTFANSNTNLEQLGEAMKYVAPVAKGAGVSFEQTAAAIGILGDAGIQGSMAGTTLRGAISRLLEPSAKASKRLRELGVSAVDSEGELRPLDDIVEQLGKSGATTGDLMAIFGQRAGPGMQVLVSKGAKGLRELTSEIENSGGTADRIAKKQMEGLKGSLKELRSAAEGLAIEFSESGVIESMTGLARGVTGAVRSMAEFSPETLKLIAAVVAIGIALGPVIWIVGNLVTAFGVAASAATWMAAKFLASSAGVRLAALAMRTSTLIAFGAIGLAIAVVVGAAYMLVKHWDTVVGALGAAWKWMDQAAGDAFRAVAGAVSDAWNAVKSATSAAWGWVLGALRAVWDSIRSAVTTYFNIYRTVIETVWNAVRAVTVAVWDAIKSALSAVWGAIRALALAVFNTIRSGIERAWGMVKSTTAAIWSAIQSALSAVWGGIKSAASTVFGAIRSVIVTAWNTVRSTSAAVWDAIKSALSTVWGAIKSAASTAWNAVKKAVVDPIMGAVATVRKAVEGLAKWLGVSWSDIAGGVDKIRKPFTAAFEKIRDSIESVVGWLGKVKDAVMDAVSWIRKIKLPKINLPDVNPFGGAGNGTTVGPPKGKPASVDGFNGLAAAFGNVVTSGLRPGDDGWHGQNRARDYAGGNMMGLARALMAYAPNLLELIFTPLGVGVKNGSIVPISFFGSDVMADHHDHVHVAMAQGGIAPGGWIRVGELGAEDVRLPAGSEVRQASESTEDRGGPLIGQVIVNRDVDHRDVARELAWLIDY